MMKRKTAKDTQAETLVGNPLIVCSQTDSAQHKIKGFDKINLPRYTIHMYLL